MADEPRLDPRQPRFGGPAGSPYRAPVPARDGAALPAAGKTAVVIGLDGSDTSWDAFWWGCGEARRMSRRAVAVFVSPTIDAGTGLACAAGCPCDYTEIDRRATDRASELESEAHRHATEHGYDLVFVHARGDPAQELVRVATTLECDLIVVGRSAKALHRVAGSLGGRLLRTRRAPVVAVVP
jgi:nucleotide-binding universal stress UspA family protein